MAGQEESTNKKMYAEIMKVRSEGYVEKKELTTQLSPSAPNVTLSARHWAFD